MKQNFKFLQTFTAAVLLTTLLAAFSSCSKDDDPKSENKIVGEWIGESDIYPYYQFLSDGSGVYICLADEPGFNPEHPEASIKHPVDPHYFTYTIEGDILTMVDEGGYYDVQQIDLQKDILLMKWIRWSSDGIDWDEHPNSPWETFKRWNTPK